MSSLQGTTPIPLTESTTEPTGAVSSSTKQQLELHTTSGMKGSDKDTKERNVSAFYKVVWPILEKEGGWTLVRFCFIFVYVLCVSKRLERYED